jgi:hypothetical protein
VKGALFLPVQVRPGELSVHPSSYRGDPVGNCPIEAHGTWVRLGRIGKSTGRNVSEAWASLESDGVRADLFFSQGRPLGSVGATDRGPRSPSPGYGARHVDTEQGATRETPGREGSRPSPHRVGWGRRGESEGSTVPLGPARQHNRQGGKGPGFGVRLDGPRGGRVA